ncbi:MAG: magnesium transporter [Cellvibrionales bacterium]|jgi:magnesium transporter|nr:magnesium transporter [Cellvibrionales bacterium]
MPSIADHNQDLSRSQEVADLLQSGTFQHARHMLKVLAAEETAHLIESSPPPSRQILWALVDEERRSDVLPFLGDELQTQFVLAMENAELVALSTELETDDMVDILQQLPDRLTREVLQAMTTQDRQRVTSALSYPENTAGGLMNTDTITVRARHSIDVVLRYLRRHDEIPDMTDNLYVVNRSDEFIGILPLAKILVSDPNKTVREIMLSDVKAIPVDMPDDEVARRFERKDWVSAPVVNENGKLLGRITIDDIVDVIREDADHSLMSMAGLDEEEDTFSPVIKTTPRRALWLGLNLITAFIAAAVINVFQDSIDKVVALAILMPIVASMGGVAGTQTLTIVVRGLAIGHIKTHNQRWLIIRELAVGIINALLWAAVVAVAAALWFDDMILGGIIAAAMIINLITAALAGAILPLALNKANIDPALAGSVALTTITDVVGFMSFLGLATLFYA